ncbi:MAG TPA: signal peptide peptidase SppA [Candidatus Bilamarchaeum sp.]|nr:signal peptide peptidase SppA [Candidatus Bilamarchaeum sp.]
MRKRPAQPPLGLVVGTGLLLVLAFMALIALFFILSALTPSFVGKCVAVVDLNTEISVDGTAPSVFGGPGTPGSAEIASAIDSLNGRDDVGAVLFVVNSPGGSVVATREIYSSVKNLDKPSVAYFREVAASGAYYVSSGTDYIVSDPDALTGSIGVIATFTDLAGLFDKLGVNVTAIKSGPHKDIGSPYRNMTANETAIMQALINEVYDEFRSVVLENRGKKLDRSKFDEITDGRILSGRQAYKVGLVDQLGTKKDAIMKAAELGGIEASSAEDVRLCPVSTMASDGGLFSVESISKALGLKSSKVSINFQ